LKNIKYIVLTTIILLNSVLKAQDLSDLKNTKPVTFGGGLNLQTGFYSINGAKSRQPGFTYILSGSPTLTVYGISLPFSFTFSNYQRDFRQPFNQFGLSPTYKWLTVHAGYRNITYSQFTMAGYTILGGGIELKPKNFRFALLYGRSQKAVKDDTSKQIESSLNGINYPAYKRMLTAVKLGYGSANNFLDIHILRGKDDSTSLPFRPTTTIVLPSKNQVFGANGKLSFLKKKLVLQGEGAISAYTRDIAFASIDAENSIVNKLIKANITTQVYSAFETQLDYNIKNFGIGAKYRKVAPDYKSMGAYFFQTDFEQYLGNLKFGLAKGKIRFSGSAGVQKDNLSKKKLATTARNIYTGNLSLNPNTKFGADISFSNFGTSQKAGKRNLSDTAVINQINNSVTVSPRYIIVSEKKVTTWQAILGRQALNDKNRFTENYTEVQMVFANLMWLKTMIKTNVNYNAGLNYNESKNIGGTIGLVGLLGGISKSWKEGKISNDFNTSFNSSTFDGKFNGYVGNLQYNFAWQMAKKHKMSVSINALFNESKNKLAGTSFQEYFARINYGFTL
jgi:hypothetical protein